MPPPRISFPEYDSYIDEASKKHGLDPNLIRSIIMQESRGNAKAKSPKGAIGLMQIMPKLGLKWYHMSEDDLQDPQKNIHVGVSHFAEMMKKYKGDINKALAAYNAGEGAVNKAGGVPKFKETQDYVKNVTGYYSGELEPPKLLNVAAKAKHQHQRVGKDYDDPGDRGLNMEAAAEFIESKQFKDLKPWQQDEIIRYLRKYATKRTTAPPPDTATDVLNRRNEVPSIVGSTTPAEEFGAGALGEPGRGAAHGAGLAARGMAQLPNTVEHAFTDMPTKEERERAKHHPRLFTDPPVRGVGLATDRLLLDPQLRELQKAKDIYQSGGSKIEAAGHLGAGILPVAGPMAGYFGERLGSGDISGAIGEGSVYFLADALAKGVTKSATPAKRLAAAAGGGARAFEDTIADINRAARKNGWTLGRINNRVPTLGDLEDVVKKGSTNLESEFNIALQDVTSRFPAATNNRIPVEVANELLKRANEPHLLKTAEGRATRQYLRKRALEYQHPWKLSELNKQRMDMYNHRVSGKSAVGQMQAMRSSDEIMADKIIEDGLKEIVYGDMETLTGKTGRYTNLKKRQSELLSLQDKLHKRVDEIADAQAEYESAPMIKKVGMSVSAHAGGVTPRAHGIMSLFAGGPEEVAKGQVERAFPPTLRKIPNRTIRYAIRQTVRRYPITSLYQKTNEKAEPDKELTPLR